MTPLDNSEEQNEKSTLVTSSIPSLITYADTYEYPSTNLKSCPSDITSSEPPSMSSLDPPYEPKTKTSSITLPSLILSSSAATY